MKLWETEPQAYKRKGKKKEDKTMLEFTTEAEKVEEDLESSGIFSKNNWIIFNIIYLLQLHVL